MIEFHKSQLGLTDAVIGQIHGALANAVNAKPIEDAINRALQRVRDYTLRYSLEDERFARLTRTLALFDLFSNPGMGTAPPQAMQTDYKAAMKELEDIREGKFPDLLQLTPEDPQLSKALGETGGNRRINFNRDGGEF